MKKKIVAATVALSSLAGAVGVVFAQTASPSPTTSPTGTGTVSPTVTPRPTGTTTTPQGSPQTGLGGMN